MLNPNYLLFSLTLIISTLTILNTNSWMSMWMMLEINLMSFIPIMSLKHSLNSMETSIKYFLVQALSSSILLFLIMNMKMFNTTSLIMIPIMMKLGVPPLHFWFTNIMEGMSWSNSFILMTWQKIAPISIMALYMMKPLIMLFSIVTIITGSMGGLNQTSIRKIMTFSSINHLGWMMTIITFNELIWLKYFFLYSILTMSIMIILNKHLFNIKQMYLKINPLLSMSFSMNLISLSGLPPLMGFLPKWISIQLLTSMNLFPLTITMIMLSLPIILFYLNLMYNNLTLFSMSNPWKLSSYPNLSISLSLMITTSLPIMTPLWT
uniref:NADH-ubiquinone oxidoreductase chain 2 n=1 Tax=Aposthonia borneensis TaxID=1208762 RepID=A0A678PVU4_9NEOP|nr:NADH dehydrogenase subunit 2 [Aposthonia borneensis]